MTTFKDIIGYKKEKEELMYICDMMKNVKKYKDKNIHIPKALLLYGEPGTGKTTMAKALINESGRKCFNCRKNKSNGDFVDEIRKTFEEAKKNEPSIILLDDMDKFAEDNLEMNANKEEFATIQTCMEDLGDLDVFIIATANDIDFLPNSLLRAGRFGRKMKIDIPDFKSTEELIKHFLKTNNIKCELNSNVLTNILYKKSCASIKEVINEANIYSIYRNKKKITKDELIPAILKISSGEIEKEVDLDKRKIVAMHEAGHAVVALAYGKIVSLITIRRYGDCGGITYIRSKEEDVETYDTETELSISLAGKASTEMNEDKYIDYGAEKDIEEAVKICKKDIEKRLYLGFDYGYDYYKYENMQAYSRLDSITDKIYETIEKAYKNAKDIIKANDELFQVLTWKLLENGTLLYDDIYEIYSKYSKHSLLRD